MKVLVFGLGTFGGQIAVARSFAKKGAEVVVTDKKPREKLEDSVRELDGLGVRFVLGEHKDEDIESADLIVRSPAVPPTEPHLARARGKVTTEIVLTLSALRAPYAAVTGTKGKSTTTTLAGRMLEAGGHRVLVGGNIGHALSAQVDQSTDDTIHVVETSSFQLEQIDTFHPWIAVMLNFSPDHLDRHPNVEEYGAAKARIFENQEPSDWAVINA
ncbi:MAG: Mur ligase family protein, partial [Planctomycetota bacterium]